MYEINNNNDRNKKEINELTNKNIIVENSNEDFLIQSYLIAIDNKNKNEIKTLYHNANENNIKKDIIFELYNRNQLNSERLQFALENCALYLNISSDLIKKLMKNNHKELSEIILKHSTFMIMNLF